MRQVDKTQLTQEITCRSCGKKVMVPKYSKQKYCQPEEGEKRSKCQRRGGKEERKGIQPKFCKECGKEIPYNGQHPFTWSKIVYCPPSENQRSSCKQQADNKRRREYERMQNEREERKNKKKSLTTAQIAKLNAEQKKINLACAEIDRRTGVLFSFDPGRSLSAAEISAIAHTVTPIEDIPRNHVHTQIIGGGQFA